MSLDAVIGWASPGPSGEAARKARLILLDSLGCALAGLRHPRVTAFARAMQAAFPGEVALAGARLAPGAAAAVLATATCWDEANEGLARAHGRPALPVAPLALVARAQGTSAQDTVAAFALGYEVAARAGEAWRIRPGMHVDGSWHSLGAAACAAGLMGLDADGIARAVRLVSCQVPFAIYAPIAAGMDGRNSYPAHAALLGTMAAAAASVGMDAPDQGFVEARRIALGLGNGEREDPHPDQPTASLQCRDPPLRGRGSGCATSPSPACGGGSGWGQRVTPPGAWLIEEAYLKPFAGVRHAHYGAAAAIALRDRVPRDPARIVLATYAEALRYAGNRAPRAAISAQFSLSWAVAAALVQGDLGPGAYTDEALADPHLRGLEANVELVEDTALTQAGKRGATLTVDGISATVTGVTGDPDRPMSEAEAIAKFARFAGPTLGDLGVARAVAALLQDAPAEGLLG